MAPNAEAETPTLRKIWRRGTVRYKRVGSVKLCKNCMQPVKMWGLVKAVVNGFQGKPRTVPSRLAPEINFADLIQYRQILRETVPNCLVGSAVVSDSTRS